MPKPQSIFPGQKYNKWTVVDKAPARKANVYYLCKCDCGTTKEVSGNNLTRNKTKSCGCNWATHIPPNKLPNGQSIINTLIHRYQKRAEKKKREYSLTEQEFKNLIFQNCYYCGTKPSTKSKANHSKKDFIINNGIDRIDSSKGYILDNCVTCCKDCNYLKNDFPLDEFFEKIKLIYQKHLRNV